MRARLVTLRARTDFLRVAAKGLRAAVPGLVLQAAPGPAGAAAVRVGFTATRKLGGAVTRNRAKRRLRAAAAAVLAERGKPGMDYVLIARAGTVERPYPALVADLETALRRVSRGARAERPAAAEKERA
ncbi:MAG TPA: ribonuclease P protein component [Stellaceae bacterium]|nr:ribonuclease P protein component [Stellaceae bacterium]